MLVPHFQRNTKKLLFVGLLVSSSALYAASPYPNSSVITGISFDWANFVESRDRKAPGSDNWPVTWAANGHQYTSWGDGGGFGGDNVIGRVSLGVGRVEGSADAYTTANVWGGFNAENPATFEGKSYGLLAIDNTLYMWVSPGSGNTGFQEARLYMSTNLGATWTGATWSFKAADGIFFPTFLQFGAGYAGARDNYVYIYANDLKDASDLVVQKPGAMTLMRVPKTALMDRTQYEFFDGTAAAPTWTTNMTLRKPVFNNPEGVGWTSSAIYNAGLGRYMVVTEHLATVQGYLGIFDAPTPWGPWTTVLYTNNFGQGIVANKGFFFNFSNKWTSADGKNFTFIFSGVEEQDSWNVVKGSFTANTTPAEPITTPTGVTVNKRTVTP